MASARQVLRGVSCRDTRDVLEQLVEEGWTPEHSRGGHIRLTHADAAHPIISAKTPSTARGRLNLKSEARRAIKLGRNDILSTTLLHSAIPPLEPANIEGFPAAPSERMKKRWSKDRRAAERAKQEIILPVYPSRPLELTSKLPSALDQMVTSGKTAMSVAAKPTANADTVRNAAKIDAPVEPKAPAKTAKAPVLAKPKPKAIPVTSPAPATPIAGQGGIPVIGADILAMAMRLLSGDLQSFEITPDMVGKTLVHGGGVHLVDGAIPVLPSKAAPVSAANETGASAPKPKAQPSALSAAQDLAEKRRDLLRTALAIDPKAWLTHLELADLVEDDAGYASRQSLTQSTKHLLTKLVAEGELEVRTEGGAKRYRSKAR